MLATWCDRTLGTEIGEQINREMIKWCEAFLDEGHATWPMPGREKGFYAAWKFLAQHEWSPCGNPKQPAKIGPPAGPAGRPCSKVWRARHIPEAWQNYLSLHLAALPGWAGFIKWRADQSEYEWQMAYPIDLTQYLAVRLWYERELVQKACRKTLGIDGNIGAISTEIQRRDKLAAKAPASGTGQRGTLAAAWRVGRARARFGHEPALLMQTEPEPADLLDWIDGFPRRSMARCGSKLSKPATRNNCWGNFLSSSAKPVNRFRSKRVAIRPGEIKVRPQAQAVFCIDVRSEPLRRNLEALAITRPSASPDSSPLPSAIRRSAAATRPISFR